MLEWLKSAWTTSRVRVTVIGGVIVVATAFGTCSYDPQEVSEAQVEPEVESVGENSTETVPVSETTTNSTEETTTTTSDVETSGGDTTSETNATE